MVTLETSLIYKIDPKKSRWLQHLNEATNVIYVATEAGMPIFKEVGK